MEVAEESESSEWEELHGGRWYEQFWSKEQGRHL